MMADVFDIRSFQTARKQADRFGLGPNVYRLVVRQIVAEQKRGNSGALTAGQLADLGRRAASRHDSTGPEAA